MERQIRYLFPVTALHTLFLGPATCYHSPSLYIQPASIVQLSLMLANLISVAVTPEGEDAIVRGGLSFSVCEMIQNRAKTGWTIFCGLGTSQYFTVRTLG